jgi:hypothetical protein
MEVTLGAVHRSEGRRSDEVVLSLEVVGPRGKWVAKDSGEI